MLRQSPPGFLPHVRYPPCPCDPCPEWREIRYNLNRAANLMFCVVDAKLRGADADNHRMNPPARPVKFSFRVRRNFKNRDWTSIGLRGTHIPFRKAGTRTTAILPGSSPSYMHGDESRIVGLDAPGSNPPPATSAPSENDWSEWLWLGLIMFAIAAVATVQLMK